MPNEVITCISVQQPYADHIFFCGKWAENRSWLTRYRGELWIHASKVASGFLAEEKEAGRDPISESPTGLLVGHILGRVTVVDCVERDELLSVAPDAYLQSIRQNRPNVLTPKTKQLSTLLRNEPVEHWDHVGDAEYIWILVGQEMLHEPIPATGRLNFWKHEVDSDRLLMASPRKRSWKPKRS